MSQGGRIALRYAAMRPERVRSLMLQGAVIDGLVVADEAEQIPVNEYAKLAQSGRLDTVKQRWLEHPMMKLPAASSDARQLLEDIVDDYRGADLLGYCADAYAQPTNVIEKISSLDSPVLLLTGAHETWTRRAHAIAILDAVADGRELVFADSGHLSNLTEPGAYNRAVLDFVRTAESTR